MTLTNKLKRKYWISYIHLYNFYSYKKNIPVKGKTIPQPYVSKKDVTNVKYSLDYNQWKAIISRYIELLKECIFNGERIDLPLNMGEIEMKKYKARYEAWTTKEDGTKWCNLKIPHHTDGYKAIVKWKKPFKDRIMFSQFWKIRYVNEFKKELKNRILSNPALINKYNVA